MFNGDRLKKLRKEKKMTQDELGKQFNISHATINRYEKGVNQPDTTLINNFSDFFNVSTDYLLGKNNIRNNESQKDTYKIENLIKIPIIGTIRAGEPAFAEQNIIGYEYISKEHTPEECFFLKVIGDSMNLSRITNGDLVLVRKQNEVENGEIAVILVNGEDATIKRFYKDENTITLMPNSSNPEHKPRVINSKNIDIKVIGKVVQALIKF